MSPMIVKLYIQSKDKACPVSIPEGTHTFSQLGPRLNLMFDIFMNQDCETFYKPDWNDALQRIDKLSPSMLVTDIQLIDRVKRMIQYVIKTGKSDRYYLYWSMI